MLFSKICKVIKIVSQLSAFSLEIKLMYSRPYITLIILIDQILDAKEQRPGSLKIRLFEIVVIFVNIVVIYYFSHLLFY